MKYLSILMACMAICITIHAQNKKGIHFGKKTEVPLYYTYTDAANEGFVGRVHKVTTTTDVKYYYDNLTLYAKTFVEFDRNGNYVSYRINDGNKWNITEQDINLNMVHFPRRLLEGRIYNIPNAWSGEVTGDFSITRPLIPFGTPIVCDNSSTKYFYNNGRIDSINVGGKFGYKYKYNKEGGIISRSMNGKPFIKMKRNGMLLINTYLYNNAGAQKDKVDFSFSGNTMSVKEYYKPAIFTFDNEGRVIEITGPLSGSTAEENNHFTRTFRYENGLIVSEIYNTVIYKTFNTERKTYHSYLKYDSRGNVIRFEKNGSIFTYKYAYNQKGDWIRRTCYYVSTGDIEIEQEYFSQQREIVYYE